MEEVNNSKPLVIQNEDLHGAPIIKGAIYMHSRGGSVDPVTSLFKSDNPDVKGIGFQGGFRVSGKNGLRNYVVIVINNENVNKSGVWKDDVDEQSRLVWYNGDNAAVNHDMYQTKKGGNRILKEIFEKLDGDRESRDKIPPILAFKKLSLKDYEGFSASDYKDMGFQFYDFDGVGFSSYDVKFIGLLAPSHESVNKEDEIIDTYPATPFHNHKACFTILDTKDEEISREWLENRALKENLNFDLAPSVWKDFIINGRKSLMSGNKDMGTINSKENNSDKKIEKYTKERFLSEVFVSSNEYECLVDILNKKKNLILCGSAGVGKTFAAKRLAYSIIGEKNEKYVNFVQFHQSYSYEDFIQGFRPTRRGLILKNGPFYEFCNKAKNSPDKPFFFIIDEINRGNLSKIFGELLMLIEADKRGEEIKLLYSDKTFSVPNNVYLIGMMNTSDRSLARIDYALRRRFSFFDMVPKFDSPGFKKLIEQANNPKFGKLVTAIKEVNNVIMDDSSLGEGCRIGHSYLCYTKADEVTDLWLREVVNYDLIPLISEYWFDNKELLEANISLLKNSVL